MPLHVIASRMGVQKLEVLELVAAHRPVADAMRQRRLALLPEPTEAQVSYDAGLHAQWKRLGDLLGVSEPKSLYWRSRAKGIAARMDADYVVATHIESGVLWLYDASASEDGQRRSAVGIECVEVGRLFRVLDGWKSVILDGCDLVDAIRCAGDRIGREAAIRGSVHG